MKCGERQTISSAWYNLEMTSFKSKLSLDKYLGIRYHILKIIIWKKDLLS